MATSVKHDGWRKTPGETYVEALNLGIAGIRLTKSATGVDVRLLGDTPASNYLLWDASAGNLYLAATQTITGEQHFLDIAVTGTLSSGDSLVGLNIVATAAGTAASWVSGLYVKTTQASKAVNGYLCAAELELASTAAGSSDLAVLVLNSTNTLTGSPPACIPHLMLREYGASGSYANVFVRVFGDTGQGDTATFSATALVTSVQNAYEANANCAIRCMVGSTAVWLIGSTTAPTA